MSQESPLDRLYAKLIATLRIYQGATTPGERDAAAAATARLRARLMAAGVEQASLQKLINGFLSDPSLQPNPYAQEPPTKSASAGTEIIVRLRFYSEWELDVFFALAQARDVEHFQYQRQHWNTWQIRTSRDKARDFLAELTSLREEGRERVRDVVEGLLDTRLGKNRA